MLKYFIYTNHVRKSYACPAETNAPEETAASCRVAVIIVSTNCSVFAPDFGHWLKLTVILRCNRCEGQSSVPRFQGT